MKMETFEAAFVAAPAPLGGWQDDHSIAEGMAFADFAGAASDMEDGLSIMPEDHDVPAPLRNDLLARYLGTCSDSQGCTFYGFLFTVPGRLEVIAWIEADNSRYRIRWRGDRSTFERAALDLKLFGDAWLKDLQQVV